MPDKEIFRQPPILALDEVYKKFGLEGVQQYQRDDTERNMIKQFAVELERIVAEDPLPEGVIAFIVALQKAGEK